MAGVLTHGSSVKKLQDGRLWTGKRDFLHMCVPATPDTALEGRIRETGECVLDMPGACEHGEAVAAV